jgi:hypothetical protein
VPGDTSRPSGYRLENPARTGGLAHGAVSGGAVSGRQQPAPPSWLKVIGTTIRLWLRRRVLHVPDSGKIGRARARLGALLTVVVVVVAGSVAAAVALTARSPAAGSGKKEAAVRPRLTPAQASAQAAAAAAALANGKAAATWIAVQVGHGRVIGCDPVTCAAILAAGYPAGGQVVLQQGVSLPGPGSLIVASAAVRAQYGPQLDSLAPAVIAAFGTGASAVQVRLAVAGGPVAYSQAARNALAARRHAGQKLLRMRHVHARIAPRNELRSGVVDPRLTLVLRRLAAHYPVALLRFGDAGPLAGRTVPVRMAMIAVPTTRRGKRTVTELGAMEKLLRKLPAGDRAELMPVHAAHGKLLLELTFPAPSPL